MDSAKLIVVIIPEESREACKTCIDSIHEFHDNYDVFYDGCSSILSELESAFKVKYYEDLFPSLLERCCEDSVSIFIATIDSNIKTARRLISMKCAKVIEL